MVRTFFSTFSSIIFIFIAAPTIIINGIYHTYLNVEFYDDHIISEIHSQTIEVLSKEIATRTPKIFDPVSGETITKSLEKNFEPDLLKQTITATLRQLKSPSGDLNINLQPYHENFDSFIQDITPVFTQKLPKCSSTSSDSFKPSTTILKRIPTCLHSSMTTDQIASGIKSEFERTILSDIPPSINISPETSPILKTVSISSLNLLIKLGVTISLSLLLIIIFSLYPNRRKTLISLGIVLAITGFISFFFAIIIPKNLLATITENSPHYSENFLKLIATFINFPSKSIIYYSSIILIISVILLITGLLSPNSQLPSQTKPEPDFTPKKIKKPSPKKKPTLEPTSKKDSKPKKKPVQSKTKE